MPEIDDLIVPPLRARVGIVLPSANPVVEEEMRALLPPTVRLHATRLPPLSGDLQVRTDRYIDHYPDMVRSFGDLALDAILIAQTGASYRLGPDGDRTLNIQLTALRGTPVETISLSILDALGHLGADGLWLLSPYPRWLTERSERYWAAAGLRVHGVTQMAEEFVAYTMDTAGVVAALRRLEVPRGVPVLMSGTGMTTLDAIRLTAPDMSAPVLSSNLCGAWSLLRRLGVAPLPGTFDRLAPALASALARA
ncbi:MAG: arylmalonate decarboxylase [Proteobacteria bacterium]|nr:arylmalonate decarboxylase [Pseudomonadota bacterium]